MKLIHTVAWTLPFLSFLLGYYCLNRLYHISEMQTPSLVGKKLPEALSLLSAQQLNVRILTEKEEADLPEGTILSQTPLAHSAIKANQAVFCVISKKPLQQSAPDLIKKTKKECINIAQQKKIRIKEYCIASNAPTDLCIAQSPAPNTPLDAQGMIIYLSAGNEKPIIFPSCIAKRMNEVSDFLEKQQLASRVSHTKPVAADHVCSSCVVVDQRPLPGSIMKLNPQKPITVQLHVSPA